MKTRTTFAASLVAAFFISTTSAKLYPAHPPEAQAKIALPIPHDVMSGSGVTISDVLGRERSINIFAGFTRDIESVSKRLEGSQNTTLLAPLNTAITRLPRKPWEDPQDYAALGQNAYDGQSGEDRAHRNLRRFVEAHVVPESPWAENQKIQTLGGDTVWWEHKDGKKLIQPGGIEVSSVPNKVANGEVWVLEGARNYA
ncbi:hypothetical protein D6D01_00384 [Aureobasidium pullulans]|uniref:FAS1 domain-containing protein n=1 Tax=Aureobasidium pullulans TaxID=5580 RepID=A0A4V4JYB3_AURPU|nr:hypothetical protein D6D01_00384 [Aureobasidium pullulans]